MAKLLDVLKSICTGVFYTNKAMWYIDTINPQYLVVLQWTKVYFGV